MKIHLKLKPHFQNTSISSFFSAQYSKNNKYIAPRKTLIKKLNRTGPKKNDTIHHIFAVHQLWTLITALNIFKKMKAVKKANSSSFHMAQYFFHSMLPCYQSRSTLSSLLSYYIQSIWERSWFLPQWQSFRRWKLLTLQTLENSGVTGNKLKNKGKVSHSWSWLH